jgi:hypothetical protein
VFIDRGNNGLLWSMMFVALGGMNFFSQLIQVINIYQFLKFLFSILVDLRVFDQLLFAANIVHNY